MQRLIERIVERIGRKAAEKAGNSASWPYIYQPKEPEIVRNLLITGKKDMKDEG